MIRGTDVRMSTEEQAAIMARLHRVVESNFFMWGEQQEEFQRRLAVMTGRKHAITYANASTALAAIFDRWGHDCACFQGNQFPIDVFAAHRAGYYIRWADIDLQSLTLTVEELQRVAGNLDVAVIQHTGGFVTDDILKIKEWCARRGVLLIEDASQAMGTLKSGSMAGHWGDVSVISFSATKFVTTGGQGGVVLTDDDGWAQDLLHYKLYGRTEMFQRGKFRLMGYNGQMTELQAAFGNALLDTIDNRIKYRSQIAKVYEQLFDDTSIRPLGHRRGRPNWYKYPVILPGGVNRDSFKEYCLAQGVQMSSEVYNLPIYRIESFSGSYDDVKLPNTEKYSAQHVCLPMHEAMTVEDAETVVKVVNKYFRERS